MLNRLEEIDPKIMKNFSLNWSDFANLYKKIKILISEFFEKKSLEYEMNGNYHNNNISTSDKIVKFVLTDTPKCKIFNFFFNFSAM